MQSEAWLAPLHLSSASSPARLIVGLSYGAWPCFRCNWFTEVCPPVAMLDSLEASPSTRASQRVAVFSPRILQSASLVGT